MFIVREDHAHPPQELNDPGWAYRRGPAGGAIHSRSRADLRRHGRPRARRHRDRAGRGAWLLQLRSQIRAGGSRHLLPAPVSSNVYELVQKLTLTAHKALGCRGVSRADFRFDDTPGGSGQVLLPRGQYAARHDADLAGSGARGTRRALVCRAGELDGGGGELQQVGPRPDIRWRADRPPAPRPALRFLPLRSHLTQAPLVPVTQDAHARSGLTC